MPPLVTYDEQADYLGLVSGTDKTLIEDLLAQAQSLFESQIGRTNAPFGPAEPGRIEIHPGDPGSALLTLDYPIAAITSIGIGVDVAVPDTILTPSMVVWAEGTRDIYRTDGGYWRNWWGSTWVQVVYDTADDRPADVKLAIKQRVATLYNSRGKQGFSSVTRGARSWTMADAGQGDTTWDDVVNAYRRAWFK